MGFWSKLWARLFEDTSTTGTKFSTLDGLRGLAVLTVFLSHSSGFRQRLTPWTSFHGTGHLGVYLFFVLSGFLLAGSLLGAPKIQLGRFYLRRFLRIAPLFYLVITTVFLCQWASGRVDLFNLHIQGGWAGYLRHLLFYQGDSVFWTIAAEFEFYFVLPFLALFLIWGGARAAWAFAGATVFYGVWYALIQSGRVDAAYSLKVARIVHHSQYLDVFGCGILAAWLFQRPGFAQGWQARRAWLNPLAGVLGLLAVGVAWLLCAENIFGLGRFYYKSAPWRIRLGLMDPRDLSLVWALVFSFITLACLNGHRLFERLMNTSLLRLIGLTGFSWYLVHFPILRLVNHLYGLPPTASGPLEWTWKEPCALFTSFGLASAAAVVLYLGVEKPFMMLSRSLLAPAGSKKALRPVLPTAAPTA